MDKSGPVSPTCEVANTPTSQALQQSAVVLNATPPSTDRKRPLAQVDLAAIDYHRRQKPLAASVSATEFAQSEPITAEIA